LWSALEVPVGLLLLLRIRVCVCLCVGALTWGIRLCVQVRTFSIFCARAREMEPACRLWSFELCMLHGRRACQGGRVRQGAIVNFCCTFLSIRHTPSLDRHKAPLHLGCWR
jgi:hypothetical protein